MLAPVLLLTGLFIAFEDGSPVVFRQSRIGARLRKFTIYKFRSMPLDTKSISSDKARDLKITRVGKVIRRTNIDELPQLVNILKGDMSIVGPRPALPSQESLIEIRMSNGSSLLRPGLTGLAQINAYDGMTPAEKAEFDGKYAKDVTFVGDLWIFFRTFVYLFERPPVY